MTPIYFIECDFIVNGHRSSAWVERDTLHDTKESTIVDILTGQVENVRRVIEVCLDECRSRDVTEDIARDVVARLTEYPEGGLLDFLEEQLGCRFMADLAREMEAA